MTLMGQEGKAASNRGHPGGMMPFILRGPKGGKHTALLEREHSYWRLSQSQEARMLVMEGLTSLNLLPKGQRIRSSQPVAIHLIHWGNITWMGPSSSSAT